MPPPAALQISTVAGAYDYHHYMQDRFDDAGWGCAYRSLQTLASWLRAQHYTSRPPPSHAEIQKALVGVGDKPPEFVGSKARDGGGAVGGGATGGRGGGTRAPGWSAHRAWAGSRLGTPPEHAPTPPHRAPQHWIGAIELSYVLDALYGVTCRVMAIPDGAEVPAHARALAAHFETQGTPVMVGGGVLAYTLLGVARDEASGAAWFLVLDPHYTGAEDEGAVLKGGWCAWKAAGDAAAAGGDLFVKGAFYNLLCPQRPACV